MQISISQARANSFISSILSSKEWLVYVCTPINIAFERVNGIKIPYVIKPRRAGDIATCFADPTRAKEQLGWVAEKNLDDMCRDTWNFAKQFIK